VEWLGKVNELELAALYRASDIAVLPSVSRAEAFGYAQLEAMASGKPVISTRLGTGTDAVNLHGKTGLVVPPGNARALSDAMTALGRDAALRRRMGAAGRARAAREFTRARMVEHVLDVYREVLAR
jgi:rhamnosyl/mannosyltransferase